MKENASVDSKPIVAVDIDEVLFPFVDEFVKHHNLTYDTQLSAADFTTYRFEEVLGGTFEQAAERVYAFTELGHEHIDPLNEAKGLQSIAEEYSLVAVTARNPRFESQTKQWLEKHFPTVFQKVVLIGCASAMEQHITKAQICQEIGAIALIDDSVSHVTECAAVGVTGILFGEYPWNASEYLPENVFRCTNWEQVAECLNER